MKAADKKEDPFGVLIVDKEKGMTSHDVVDRVRKRFKIRKVGHAGTLDPCATGVLVLLLGRATKLSGTFLNQDKEYTAVMKLGERTESGDSEGKVIQKRQVRVSEGEIKPVMKRFVGEIEQVPPMYSAKRVNGKKLYKLARKGMEIERPAKKVVIRELEVGKIALPLVTFRVVCGKGTYIRQLVDDIGEALECGAYLTELRRTRSGDFDITKAIILSSLFEMNRETLSNLAKAWVRSMAK